MLLPHEEYGIGIQAHRLEIGFSYSITLFRANPIRCTEEHKTDTGKVIHDRFDGFGISFRTDIIVGQACEPEQGKPVAFYEETFLILVGRYDRHLQALSIKGLPGLWKMGMREIQPEIISFKRIIQDKREVFYTVLHGINGSPTLQRKPRLWGMETQVNINP